MKTNLQVVGPWGYQCRATQQNMNYLCDQEESDTKMLLHALDATANGEMDNNNNNNNLLTVTYKIHVNMIKCALHESKLSTLISYPE